MSTLMPSTGGTVAVAESALVALVELALREPVRTAGEQAALVGVCAELDADPTAADLCVWVARAEQTWLAKRCASCPDGLATQLPVDGPDICWACQTLEVPA